MKSEVKILSCGAILARMWKSWVERNARISRKLQFTFYDFCLEKMIFVQKSQFLTFVRAKFNGCFKDISLSTFNIDWLANSFSYLASLSLY